MFSVKIEKQADISRKRTFQIMNSSIKHSLSDVCVAAQLESTSTVK